MKLGAFCNPYISGGILIYLLIAKLNNTMFFKQIQIRKPSFVSFPFLDSPTNLRISIYDCINKVFVKRSKTV